MDDVDEAGDVEMEFRVGQDAEDAKVLADGLHAVLAAQLGSSRRDTFSVILRRSDGSVAGGLLGKLLFDDLHIDLIWLHETVRGRGHARLLMREAEAHGLREGCGRAFLNTMRSGVANACERMGYHEVGRISDFAMGHAVFFLRKDLKVSGGAPTDSDR